MLGIVTGDLRLGEGKVMYVQLDGVGFGNKGAELMVDAIVERLGTAHCLVWGGDPASPFSEIASRGILRPFVLQRFKIPLHSISRILRVRGLERYGLVYADAPEAVLDAGGFRFGDAWQYSRCAVEEFRRYYGCLQRRRAKLIFLPQAFGPFEDSLSREAIKVAAEYAILIYAREQESYDHLTDCLGRDDRISLVPDFTNLVHGAIDHKLFAELSGSACVIPSSQMLKLADGAQASGYMEFMQRCIEHLQHSGMRVIVLNHAGGEDLAICETLSRTCGLPPPITGLSAKQIKGVLGCCAAVISSRFHGVASCLSQGTPCLATSWSHKYRLLFEDYGVRDAILRVNGTMSLEDSLSTLTDVDKRAAQKSTIVQNIPGLEQKSDVMWRHVEEILKG